MERLLNFLIKNFNFLTFFLLFLLALVLTVQSHAYHKSQFINSSNYITGTVYSISNSISHYFKLKDINKSLSEENALLKKQLYNLQVTYKNYDNDSLELVDSYKVTKASVKKNSYNRPINHILIDKGINDGVKKEFGVVSSKGIIGIIEKTSGGYSKVLSILSKNTRINAKLKQSNHFGSIKWNEQSSQHVQLVDVSNFAPVKVCDTIVTGGQSIIFPKGINIGTIESFTTDISGDSYIIEVKLINDMTNLDIVYVVEHTDKLEIENLQNSSNE